MQKYTSVRLTPISQLQWDKLTFVDLLLTALSVLILVLFSDISHFGGILILEKKFNSSWRLFMLYMNLVLFWTFSFTVLVLIWDILMELMDDFICFPVLILFFFFFDVLHILEDYSWLFMVTVYCSTLQLILASHGHLWFWFFFSMLTFLEDHSCSLTVPLHIAFSDHLFLLYPNCQHWFAIFLIFFIGICTSQVLIMAGIINLTIEYTEEELDFLYRLSIWWCVPWSGRREHKNILDAFYSHNDV